MTLSKLAALSLLLGACSSTPSATEPGAMTAPAPPASGAGAAAAPSGPGDCGSPSTPKGTSLETCTAGCDTLAAEAPAGSKCLPPRTACQMNCKHLYPAK